MPPAEQFESSQSSRTTPIAVRVAELQQIFHSLDPTPFRERDLDPRAEEFIVGWARDLGDRPLSLTVHVDREMPGPEHVKVLQDAVKEFFGERALETRRRLRQLLRVGRTSLIIGLVFLTASILLADFAASLLRETRYPGFARESLMIGGWVAMWRPLEIFLYDWWPIRAEARLFDRLSAMPVSVVTSRST